MSTAENPARPRIRYPLDLDEIERMTPEERAQLDLPDHTQLPDDDGTFVQNFQEHPQTVLLTDTIRPVLDRIHPDGHYLIGQDCGIYWRLTDPPLRGVKCPDWCYIPNIAPLPDGTFRRSYVLWQEWVRPVILLEIVSGDGSEERDRTPYQGKFWVYEHAIKSTYYGIFEAELNRIEMYHRVNDRFALMPANERGRYAIEEIGVELGLWHGQYLGQAVPWMRWWDPDGNLILTGHEIAGIEAARADLEARRAGIEADRVEKLRAQLLALGLEPDA